MITSQEESAVPPILCPPLINTDDEITIESPEATLNYVCSIVENQYSNNHLISKASVRRGGVARSETRFV